MQCLGPFHVFLPPIQGEGVLFRRRSGSLVSAGGCGAWRSRWRPGPLIRRYHDNSAGSGDSASNAVSRVFNPPTVCRKDSPLVVNARPAGSWRHGARVLSGPDGGRTVGASGMTVNLLDKYRTLFYNGGRMKTKDGFQPLAEEKGRGLAGAHETDGDGAPAFRLRPDLARSDSFCHTRRDVGRVWEGDRNVPQPPPNLYHVYAG